MDNPEKPGTSDTKAKKKHNIENQNDEQHGPTKIWGEPMHPWRISNSRLSQDIGTLHFMKYYRSDN